MLRNSHLVWLVLSITVLLHFVSSFPTSPPSTTKPPYLFDSHESPRGSSEEDAWYNYIEEEPCEPGEFWHIRGRRCVPHKCPRANWMRNWKTGECLYTEEGEVKRLETRKPLQMTMFQPTHAKSFRIRPRFRGMEVQRRKQSGQDSPNNNEERL